jgi:hypothetical protein
MICVLAFVTGAACGAALVLFIAGGLPDQPGD